MAHPDLPAALKAHLAHADLTAQSNLAEVVAQQAPALRMLERQLRQVSAPATPVATRLPRLRFLAAQWTKPFAEHSACASGCSHCCNISVAVPRTEAKLIAKTTGAALAEPKRLQTVAQIAGDTTYFGAPCTFLHAGRCSIYAARPLVCRTLVNMDTVDLLCRLVPGMSVPVPYLNTSELQGYFGHLTQADQFADIREWFPA